jgi:tetratricopeptide (TPR) repeat protein
MHGADDWAEKGRSLLAAKQYAEALDAFQKAIDIDEEHAGAWEGKSRFQFDLMTLRERNKPINHQPYSKLRILWWALSVHFKACTS